MPMCVCVSTGARACSNVRGVCVLRSTYQSNCLAFVHASLRLSMQTFRRPRRVARSAKNLRLAIALCVRAQLQHSKGVVCKACAKAIFPALEIHTWTIARQQSEPDLDARDMLASCYAMCITCVRDVDLACKLFYGVRSIMM